MNCTSSQTFKWYNGQCNESEKDIIQFVDFEFCLRYDFFQSFESKAYMNFPIVFDIFIFVPLGNDTNKGLCDALCIILLDILKDTFTICRFQLLHSCGLLSPIAT